MEGSDLLGFVAGALTTMAFWPQLRRTWVTKSAGDISLGMLLIFSTGVTLWLCYGFVLRSKPIILPNLSTRMFTSGIIFLNIHHRT